MVLQYLGLKSNIVGFHTHYLDSYECITACSRSGEVKTWKVRSGFKLLEKVIKAYALTRVVIANLFLEYF